LYEHKYIISNFGIQNIFNIVKSEKYDYVVRGNVDGEIIFPNINSPKEFDADIAIRNLMIADTLAGNMMIKINSTEEKLIIDTRLGNEENRISLSGVVLHPFQKADMDLKLSLTISNLKRLERFTFNELSEMSGKIQGDISVKEAPTNQT